MESLINKLFALILIIALLPIYFLISLIVLISDGFPIIFKQKKFGLNHKVFYQYKFRTMKINTPQIATENFKNPNKYLLRSGEFLRKFSLDELPQFFNILKGDMHFIGPRPSMEKNEELIKNLREEKKIHTIKPGITGWAQVNGRDLNDFHKKVDLDYYYLKNKSLKLNLLIILKTFHVIFFQKDVQH
jgi:O-antigen biosynthesis protein WbqP